MQLADTNVVPAMLPASTKNLRRFIVSYAIELDTSIARSTLGAGAVRRFAVSAGCSCAFSFSWKGTESPCLQCGR